MMGRHSMAEQGTPWDGRHPSVQHFRPLFAFEHLPAGPLRDTSEVCAQVAGVMLTGLADGPELAAGLRKLLEAKDCFVRQAVIDRNAHMQRDATTVMPAVRS